MKATINFLNDWTQSRRPDEFARATLMPRQGAQTNRDVILLAVVSMMVLYVLTIVGHCRQAQQSRLELGLRLSD